MRGRNQLWFMSCLKTVHRSCAILRYIHQIIYCKKERNFYPCWRCRCVCYEVTSINWTNKSCLDLICVFKSWHDVSVFSIYQKLQELPSRKYCTQFPSLKPEKTYYSTYLNSYCQKCTKGWYIGREYNSISEKIHIFFFQGNTDRTTSKSFHKVAYLNMWLT